MLKFGSKGDNNVVHKCMVRLLEDTEIVECEYKVHVIKITLSHIHKYFTFQNHHKGKYLLELVCKQLNIVEQDYLGLRYVDTLDQRVQDIFII